MKKLIIFFTVMSMCFYANAQTWDWTHPEPNGPNPAASESDAAHHVKTDGTGNVYVLGNYLGSFFLNNDYITGNGSYLAKYDPAGTLLWYQLITPNYATTSGDTYIKATDLVVNSSGVYITGKYNYSYGSTNPSQNCALVVGTNKAYKIGSYNFTSGIYDIGFFVAKFDSDGNFIWNKTATDSYPDQYGCLQPETCGNCGSTISPVFASDLSNNLTVAFNYVSYHPGIIFDGTPIPSARTTNPSGLNGVDLVFINMNSDGGYRWSNTASAYPYFLNNNIVGGELECISMVADNTGNVFLIGLAGDKSQFGANIIQSMPSRSSIRYIAKLSSLGVWQFAKALTEIQVVALEGTEAAPNLLTVDNDNNIYISLTIQRDPSGNAQYILGSLINPAFMNPYLVKADNNGNLVWVKSFGTNTAWNSDNYATGIYFQNNNLYVTGAIRGGYSYSNFSNLTVPSTNTSYLLEYTVAKADLEGNFQWVNRFSGGSNVGGFSIAAFGNNIYTTGYYRVNITTLGPLGGSFTNSDIYTHQIFFGKLKDQYIKIGAVSPTTLCPGRTFTIPFTSNGLTFSNGNIFTAQLSDVNGNFANATDIGSTVSTGSGSITATLPANLSIGSSGYKVRIVSSDLLNTGFPYYSYADINYNITVGNQTFYQDIDGDGYGVTNVTSTGCTAPQGYVAINGDCNDTDASVHPGAVEICDGKDNDCNGQIDEGLPAYTYYRDTDADGFGDANTSVVTCSAIVPNGYVTNNSDCDDTKKLYQDNDSDSYGSTTLVACGGVTSNTDCNDNNSNINPNKVEICDNGFDDNCNGQIDEGCTLPPAISINDISVYESQGLAILTVTLSKTSTEAIKINYATADGTALSKGRGKNPIVDYIASKGTLIIPAGSITRTITITIVNDGLTEAAEYFDVQLSIMKNVNAAISDGSGRVTILDATPTSMAKTSPVKEEQSEDESLLVKSYPNPTQRSFTIILSGNNYKDEITLLVTDISGRIIETKNKLRTGQAFKLGENYQPGVYIIEIIQGTKRKKVKLVKL